MEVFRMKRDETELQGRGKWCSIIGKYDFDKMTF